MHNIYTFLVVLVIFLIIDIPMITKINGAMYQEQFLRINKTGLSLDLRTFISAGISYLLLAFGIYYFAVKDENIQMENRLIRAGLLGLVIYGIYNTTNLATIKEFGIKEAIVDTIWGTFLSIIITYISVKTIQLVKSNDK